jgi:hypothetical protein
MPRSPRGGTPSPAMIVALVALFVALGGVGYAALTIPRDSVGKAQLKRNAVVSGKVKDGGLRMRDFKRGELPTGDAGPQGPPGRSALTPLGPGETISGVFVVVGTAAGADEVADNSVTFQIPSRTAFDGAHIEILPPGGTSANCAGRGQAAPGFLCLYQTHDPFNTSFDEGDIFDVENASGQASAIGFSIEIVSDAAGPYAVYGSWTIAGA